MLLSRTDELLLHCLRGAPDAAGAARFGAVSNADWEDLFQQAGRHGVLPLLCHRLRTVHADMAVPAEVMARLRQAYLANAARNMGLFHTLGQALAVLRRDHIPVLVLKGAHLAELVYGNCALRAMGDVDLLVRNADLARVEKTLLALGYIPTEPDPHKATEDLHVNYWLPSRGLPVEVHWNLLPASYSCTVDIAGVWERSRPAMIAGVDVAVLGPEDLLLFLCLHTAKHLFEMGLKPFCDLLEVMRYYGPALDWQEIQRRSGEWGAGKSVYLTLQLARELVDAPVPDDLLLAVQPDNLDARVLELARKLIFARVRRNGDSLSNCPNLARVWGSRQLLNKAVLFLRRVFPTRQEMARLYPVPADSIRVYCYYPVRIKDLLSQYGRQVWRLVRHDEGAMVAVQHEEERAILRAWLGG